VRPKAERSGRKKGFLFCGPAMTGSTPCSEVIAGVRERKKGLWNFLPISRVLGFESRQPDFSVFRRGCSL